MKIRKLFLKKSRDSFSYIEKDVFNKIDNEWILQHFKNEHLYCTILTCV